MGPRRTRSAIVIVPALVLAAGAAVVPARAVERSTITVRPGDVVQRSYPGVPVTNPEATSSHYVGEQVGYHHIDRPSACREAQHCDVIALEVEPPPVVAPDELFVVRIDLTFPVRMHDVAGAPQEETNLDLYLWQNDEDERPVASSTSREPPEVIFYSPTKRERLSVVVVNVVGTNDTYTVRVATMFFEAEEPLDASQFNPTRPAGIVGSSPAGEDFIEETGGSPGGGAPLLGGTSEFGGGGGLAPLLMDPDFGSTLDTRSAVEIAVEEAAARTTRQQRPPKPVPEDPSAAELLAWLVLVPAGVVAGERALFRRRTLPQVNAPA